MHKSGYLTLNPHLCHVDAWVLERLLNKAEKRDQGDPDYERLTERIFDLYQGPFLKGEEFPWAYSTRQRLASRFMRYLRRRGRYLEKAEEYDQAVTLHQKGLEADPLSEGHYRCLMSCYNALGRRAEAIAVYQRCRKALQTLQGAEPSRETEALYRKIILPKKN